MRISDTLKKAAGLFVEFEETPSAPTGPAMSDEEFKKMMATPAPAPAKKTVEQIVREQPGPNLDEIKLPQVEKVQVQPLRADGTVDYDAIYKMANVTGSPFTAEQLLELLATLPAELPLEARRQTVKITIQAMAKTVNVTPEIIVADASRKLAALAAYAEGHTKQAHDFVAKSELEIRVLEEQIAAKKKAIEDARQKESQVAAACDQEADRLDDVLEFFSMDVAPSKYATP